MSSVFRGCSSLQDRRYGFINKAQFYAGFTECLKLKDGVVTAITIPIVSQNCRCSAVDRLRGLRQDGRPLERYVEEFSELSCLVNWPDALLNACFLMGLDEDMIRYIEPACSFSLVESINLILFLNGSDFEIEEVHKKSYLPRPVPSEKQVAWSVHQPPVSSTYPSSGYSPVVLPDPKPKPPRGRTTARPRWPKRMTAASPEPPAAQPEHSPREAEWLIDFWTEPVLHEQAPVLHEQAPSLREPAPAADEPAPAADEPAPAHQHVPAHVCLPATTESPKKILGGGPYTCGWGS
ncbi:hypothetical protein DPX16_20630 [Anabarilius grahami]|uniref:Retrotransposon gag domain-containing protein n=1 Tax=Anabarilius grahami TaxID=495550 RepID=A0A3N0YML8_ANAGA|nr:hypothetical protein DPX16_20630 [Anabarilius grahami]